MANLPESPTYDVGVYQLETTDPVLGGVNGVSNSPLKNLANRTTYLKQHLDNIESGTTIPPGVAPLNSPNFSGSPTVPTPFAGSDGIPIANTTFVQRRHHGILSRSVAGGANVTLSGSEAGYGIINLTGTITADIAVIFPDTGKWLVSNNTAGSFDVTCKTAAGSGVTVRQTKTREIWADGSNVLSAESDFDDVNLTGVSTTFNVPLGNNSSQIANTSFVQNTVYGRLVKDVAGGTTTSLTTVEAGNGILEFTGALTANKLVEVPLATKSWIVLNSTTGEFALTLKTAAGIGVVLPRDEPVFAYCDGTDVALAGSANQNSFVYDNQVATGSQTSFSFQYTPGSLIVFQNGGLLEQDEYTATDGSSVVLNAGATAGDELVFYAFKSFEVADALVKSANLSDVPDAAVALANLGGVSSSRILTAYKTADTSRSSTSTITADPHLQLSLDLNSTYKVTGFLKFNQPASAPGLAIDPIMSSAGISTLSGVTVSESGSNDIVYLSSSNTSNITWSGIAIQGLSFSGLIDTESSGDSTWSFGWAQVVSDINGTIVYAGSWIRAEKLN